MRRFNRIGKDFEHRVASAGARELPTGANNETKILSTAVLTKSCAKRNPACSLAAWNLSSRSLEVRTPESIGSSRASREELPIFICMPNDARTTGLLLHTSYPSLLSNVYIPRFLLDLSCAPLSFAGLARFVPLFAKRRCFREWRQRQVFSYLSADKSEDCHAKKTSNPVR